MSKQWISLSIVVLFVALTAAGCATPAHKPSDPSWEQSGDNFDDYEESENSMRIMLYFRNQDYKPGEPDVESLVAVPRWIEKTEALVRATAIALFQGPTARESERYAAAPIVDQEIIIEDIYIQGGFCIIHLDYEEPLFANQSLNNDLAEDIFVRSVVRTLTDYDSISSVWLFHQGGTWQGDTRRWCGPTPLPDRTVPYALYFMVITEDKLEGHTWGSTLEQVEIELESGFFAADCPFSKIIELLAGDYDCERSAVLPEDNRALGFVLQDGVLTIDLTGNPTRGHQAAVVMMRSLVYTFTELPEIDRVKVTLDGEPWSDGHFVWDIPLGVKDLP